MAYHLPLHSRGYIRLTAAKWTVDVIIVVVISSLSIPRRRVVSVDFNPWHLRQEEQTRQDNKQKAILEERAKAELDRRQNCAACQIQRIMRAFLERQAAANKGKKGKGKGGGKKGKKGKK